MSDKKYDKMNDYIESLFNVFQVINKKAEIQKDKRLKFIALGIYNYIRNYTTRVLPYTFHKTIDKTEPTINPLPALNNVLSTK